MFSSKNWKSFQKDEGTLWAFRVTGANGLAVDPADPFNGANDYLDIAPGDDLTGEFIPVPADVARGDTADLPQDALEDWSNANNVFQFVRVEDIAYDPDNPRIGLLRRHRQQPACVDPGTGRLYRASSGGAFAGGRIFKIVMNADDPTVVDSFSVVLDAASIGMRTPDNVAVSHNSLMVQEDTSNFSKIWLNSLGTTTWTHIATGTQQAAETSGIVDVSRWFGDGWWALDVQSHENLPGAMPGQVYTGPGPNNGVTVHGPSRARPAAPDARPGQLIALGPRSHQGRPAHRAGRPAEFEPAAPCEIGATWSNRHPGTVGTGWARPGRVGCLERARPQCKLSTNRAPIALLPGKSRR